MTLTDNIGEDGAIADGSNSGSAPVRLLLAGGGHAHLGVLVDWISQQPQGVETIMVTPSPFSAYSGMIPGWMAGFYNGSEQMIDLRPLALRAGAQLVIGSVCKIDVVHRQICLSDGQTIAFDWLSLATGGEADTSSLALLGQRLLPVRPSHEFVAAWPQVLAKAALAQQYHIVIVGGGAAGTELALAANQALRKVTVHGTVTIVSDEAGLVPGHSQAVQGKVRASLAAARISVRNGHGVGTPDGILLEDGSTISADCVIAATGSKAPYWLRTSGLKLDGQGFIAIGSDLRSVSHERVFAAGDIAGRTDRQVARSGVHAVKAGPVLAANLRAALRGDHLQSYIPRRRTLYLLSTGDRRAILSWGPITMSGRAMWWLKNWIDRRFINRLARLGRRGVRGA